MNQRLRVIDGMLKEFPAGYDEQGVYMEWKQRLDTMLGALDVAGISAERCDPSRAEHDPVRAALIELVRLKDLKKWIESDVPNKFTGHTAKHWQRVQQYEREKEPAWEAARLALEQCARSAGTAPSERQWEWPIKTVGTLISNLQTLPAEMPFYTAYFVEIGGKRIARTTHPSLSRETVFDSRIQKFSADAASLVIWATAAPSEPDAFEPPVAKSASVAINIEAVHRFLGPNSGLTHRDVAAVLDAAQKVRP